MARILELNNQSWYDELSVVSHYTETEFETIFRSNVKEVFPDFYTISLKKPMEHDGERRIPDLLLLKKDFSEWWVVENELTGHSFDHILGQVNVFTNGDFENYSELSEYIVRKAQDELGKSLDLEKVYSCVSDEKQKVLVVIDQIKPDLENRLKKYNANLCIFEVYKNHDGLFLYRISGEYPYVILNKSHCKYTGRVGDTIQVIDTNFLPTDINSLEIQFKGRFSVFNIIRASGKVYLKSVGMQRIPPTVGLVLIETTTDKYIFEYA